MNTNNFFSMKSFKMNKRGYVSFLLLMAIVCSCKKEDDLGEAPRLFRPVIKGTLETTGNFIQASWQDVKSAESYTLQLSRDTFKTIDRSVKIDSAKALVEELQWDKLYQVQVRANHADSSKNSKFGYLGEIKTPKFPTIVKFATINDVTETSAIMRWISSGAAVTEIRVYDRRGGTLLQTVTLSAADIQNEYKVITNLSGATSYDIELYSGNTLRGYETYTTKTPFSGVVIDLREISGRPSVLQDTLPTAPSGSLIILKKGLVYTVTSTVSLSKTVTIASGDDLLSQVPASIYFTGNLNFAAGSVIDSVSFVNVNIVGSDYSSKYVFNNSNAATIGKLKFDNCKLQIFRGVVRLQSGATTINNFEINNSVVDSISGYGILTVDNVSCKVENIRITNSTVSRTELVIQSKKQASNAVLIENCTFYRAPNGGTYLIDYENFGVTAGVTLNNNIFSVGKDNKGNASPRGVRVNNNLISALNNYATSDYVNGGNPIPNLIPYIRPSSDLFTNPGQNNFTIKDAGFPGRSTAGDPRWRP